MKAIEVLKAARQLLSEPSRWTKGESARDQYGEWAGCKDPNAVRWCMMGATAAADRDGNGFDADDLLGEVVGSIEHFNDAPERTHAEVLAAFDEAIRRAEQ